jgi:NAD+ synthase
MDLCLHAHDHDVPVHELAASVGLDVPSVERVLRDIDQKRRTTTYLHQAPVLVEPIAAVDG